MSILRVEETKIVTIDERARTVEELPDKAKQLVRFYDDWKQKELEARSALLMAQTAMQAMAQQIVLAVKEDEDARAAAAEVEEAAAESEEATAE